MTAASYTIYVNSPANNRARILPQISTLAFTRSVNAVGYVSVTMPDIVGHKDFVFDTRLEIWRRVRGPERLIGETQWFVTKVLRDHDKKAITVHAESALTLLDRRIVAYAAETSQTSKSGLADDVIVEFVKENLGASVTDSDRDWSADINVLASNGLGPSVNKSATRRIVLSTCQDVARQAAELGSPVFFDMVYDTTSGKFEFRTYGSQRGKDRTVGQSALVLSPDTGNFSGVRRMDDYSSMATYIYGAGQGQADDRVVTTASNTALINSSPFGRIERLQDARHTGNTNRLIAETEAGLRNARPKQVFTGRVVNRPGALYGLHWDWGDRVNVVLDGEVKTARIDTVSVSITTTGEEIIDAEIRIE